MVTEVYSAGFPHSEISGSKDMCSSPKLIAAYHVFHRLLVPRHPPYALFCLTLVLNRLVRLGSFTDVFLFLGSLLEIETHVNEIELVF